MYLWNTATGDLFHKTMLHSFILCKGICLKIHTLTSVHKDLVSLPVLQKCGQGISIVSHSNQIHWRAMGKAQAQISSQEIQPTFWTTPAVNTKCNLFPKLHADQSQLVCKDHTSSFGKKKSLSDSWKWQILHCMSAVREAYSQTRRKTEYFNSGYGSTINSLFPLHRWAHTLTVMDSEIINWRLCITRQKSQQQGWAGGEGANLLESEGNAWRMTALHLHVWNAKTDGLINSSASVFCLRFNLRIKLLG